MQKKPSQTSERNINYNIVISQRAEQHTDAIVSYVASELNNPLAAAAILSDIEQTISKLEYTASSFALCTNPYLRSKEYRKVKLKKHNYLILYRLKDNTVFISGVFHMMENYASKL